jgi:hypothetical protein
MRACRVVCVNLTLEHDCCVFSCLQTTVIGPLLALILADGSRLVTQVVPSALLEFSRSIMRSRFTHIISKVSARMRTDVR